MSNDLRVNIIGDASKLKASLNSASSKLKSFGNRANKIGKDLSLKLTVPITLAAGAAIKMASDFEETESKFNTVFSSIQKDAQKTAETFKESFGLSELAAKDMLSATGDLLVGFGFAEQEALKLSNEVNQLAVDLASFTNFSGGAKGASEALTKALLGERESIKSLGIAITETDLKDFAAQQGLVYKELDRVARANLTYQLALKQSSKAVGDFDRTSGSFANQMRQLKGDLADLAVELGQILLPAALKLVKGARSLISRFEGFSDSTKKITIVVGLLVAAVGPLLIAIGTISKLSGLAMAGFAALTPVVVLLKAKFIALTTAMMANPFIAIGAAIVALTGYVVSLVQKMTPLVSKWNTLKNLFKSGGSYSKFVSLQLVSQSEAQQKLEEKTDASTESVKEQTEANKKLAESFQDINRSMASVVLAEGFGQEKTYEPIKGTAQMGKDPATALAESVANGNGILTEKLEYTGQIVKGYLQEFEWEAMEFNERIGPIFENGLRNLATGIGEALGQAIATGGNLGSQLGAVLLGSLGAVATQVGQMAIGIGIALEGIKKALQSLNPFVAIAAGIALIALGSFFRAKSQKISEGMGGGATAFAKGGIVNSPTLGLVGEYPGARSNPEVIAPLNKLKSMIGDRGQSQVNVSGQFALRGQDLVVALQRANNNRNRVI